MSRPEMSLPLGSACACGERLSIALARVGPDSVVCRNCRDAGRHRRGRCALCGGADFPLEAHHLAGRRKHPHLLLDVCLNCHAWLSQRQEEEWPAKWVRELDPLACLVLGATDALTLYDLRRASGAVIPEDDEEMALFLALPGVLVAAAFLLTSLLDRYMPGLEARKRLDGWVAVWMHAVPTTLGLALRWREADDA